MDPLEGKGLQITKKEKKFRKKKKPVKVLEIEKKEEEDHLEEEELVEVLEEKCEIEKDKVRKSTVYPNCYVFQGPTNVQGILQEFSKWRNIKEDFPGT